MRTIYVFISLIYRSRLVMNWWSSVLMPRASSGGVSGCVRWRRDRRSHGICPSHFQWLYNFLQQLFTLRLVLFRPQLYQMPRTFLLCTRIYAHILPVNSYQSHRKCYHFAPAQPLLPVRNQRRKLIIVILSSHRSVSFIVIASSSIC